MTLANLFRVRFIVCVAVLLLACAAVEAQVGPGTTGRIARFKTPNTVGDSVIFEDKFGMVGVGTSLPTSKLTVAGTIESTTGGIKFPDGTIQATAVSSVKDPALSAFQTELSVSNDAGVAIGSDSFDVPSNKRLVIETLTVRATTGIGGLFGFCNLTTRVNGVEIRHQCIPTFIRTGASDDFFGYQNQVRLYADAGPGSLGQASLQVGRSGAQNPGRFKLTISGYLVDIP